MAETTTRSVTIVQAIANVLGRSSRPLSYKEVYQAIVDGKLYEFRAVDPAQVVRAQLRRHCTNLHFAGVVSKNLFEFIEPNLYRLATPSNINEKIPRRTDNEGSDDEGNTGDNATRIAASINNIRMVVRKEEISIRKLILDGLKSLDPYKFEKFAGQLMKEYGFENVVVTQATKDGGIDGFGTLRVGLADLRVAFQCKRFRNATVGRAEIDKFRGAIQGEYEQGVFFVTSVFSSDAISASIKKGAAPVVLIDGNGIVDLMIAKEFGVRLENIRFPISELDLAIE